MLGAVLPEWVEELQWELALRSAVDLSGWAALLACYLLTFNILLGLLISTKYNPVRQWPHRRINTVKIHNWTGYIALGVAILHPTILLFSSTAGFKLLDIIFPVFSPHQPFLNTLGALALYSLAFVVVTTHFRFKLGHKRWKRLHYVAYATALLFLVHGLLHNPHLNDMPFQPLDEEKVTIEVCMLLVMVGIAWRVSYGMRRRRQKREAGSSPALRAGGRAPGHGGSLGEGATVGVSPIPSGVRAAAPVLLVLIAGVSSLLAGVCASGACVDRSAIASASNGQGAPAQKVASRIVRLVEGRESHVKGTATFTDTTGGVVVSVNLYNLTG